MFGWGGKGGLVYQKAYIECFTSPSNLRKLMDICNTKPSVKYYAVDHRGNTYTNRRVSHSSHSISSSFSSKLSSDSLAGDGVTAVTWGVFPSREIVQPTVFDPKTYLVWKEEAFALWLSLWANLYEEESASSRLIQEIHNTYFLVAIIENDYIHGNIWHVFDEILDELSTESHIPTPTHAADIVVPPPVPTKTTV